MEDWQGRSPEQIREQARHNERMRLEHERDRITSLRAEGFSESQIRSLNRSRSLNSCLGTILALVLIAAAFLAFGAYQSANEETDQSDEVQTSEVTQSEVEELQTPDDLSSGDMQVNSQADAGEESTAPAAEPSPEQEIIFVEKPVVQSIPSDQEGNPLAASDDPNTGDRLPN